MNFTVKQLKEIIMPLKDDITVVFLDVIEDVPLELSSVKVIKNEWMRTPNLKEKNGEEKVILSLVCPGEERSER